MNSKIAFAAAASVLLLGSAAVAQTADGATSGNLTTGLTVSPSTSGSTSSPTSTSETVTSGGTRTTTTVTVASKAQPVMAAPVDTSMMAGERG